MRRMGNSVKYGDAHYTVRSGSSPDFITIFGEVAPMVERWFEESSVVGSNPTFTTALKPF